MHDGFSLPDNYVACAVVRRRRFQFVKIQAGIEPNPGPIPEFLMVISLTDRLKLTIKCGKLLDVKNACLLVDNANEAENQDVLKLPFPVWDEYKPYSAKVLVKGLTQSEENRCSTVAFSPFIAVRGLTDTPWALLHGLLHGNWEDRDNVPDTQQDDMCDWLEENSEHDSQTGYKTL
ncbi:hypothetical protein MAR_034658, partial [Mya arenaria]